jgi:ATP-binding cassette subfamily C protein
MAHPRRTAVTVVLLIAAGVAEGVGLVTLLPILETIGSGGAENGSELAQVVTDTLRVVGIAPTLGPLLSLIVGALVVKGVFRWTAMQQVGYTIAQVATDLRLRLIRALTNARWQHFVDRSTGTFSNAISYEARRSAWAYKHACAAFADAVQVLIYFGIALVVSWPVALAAPVVGGGILYVLRGFVHASRDAGQRQTNAMETMVHRLGELLPNLKPVKAMARDTALTSLIEEEAWQYNEAEQGAVQAYEVTASFREPIIAGVLALGLYGALTVGGMALSIVLTLALVFYRLMLAVGSLQRKYQDMATGESAFWSLIGKIHDAEADAEPDPGAAPAPSLADAIEYRNVRLAYRDTEVLRNVSLTVPAGRLTTFEGPSGAGKTTLVDAMSGLLRPTQGTITVDGTPLGDIGLRSWRQQIGYVPQELALLHDTVARNVTLGDDSIPRSQVAEALRAAGAWSFVSDHPDGLDRVVGDQGGRLSGGQGQRLMIARALVHRPQLLILDEATTGVDPETEAEIFETLRELLGDLTIVVISHQSAVEKIAEVRYEVANGSVRRLRSRALSPQE